MSLLKIGVVEDELVIARTILNTLDELGYSHEGPAISYTEAIAMLENNKPDLLLLDIQLSGRKDGIDVAQKINEVYRIPFIFLTANSDAETIEKAKKVKPHAYIVKPFAREELFAAIEIAFSNFTGNHQDPTPQGRSSWQTKDHMFVKDGYAFRKILFSEILYLESDANYVTIHLDAQKKLVIRSTLNDLVNEIHPKIFLRVHRSYCVNLNRIEDVFPSELTIGGHSVPIGKSYREELLKTLGINGSW